MGHGNKLLHFGEKVNNGERSKRERFEIDDIGEAPVK